MIIDFLFEYFADSIAEIPLLEQFILKLFDFTLLFDTFLELSLAFRGFPRVSLDFTALCLDILLSFFAGV